MPQPNGYAVARVHADSYRLDRITPPMPGPAAFILRVRDRLGNPLGWKLKPLVVMQGARSRIWPDAADAIAATKLMTAREAQAAVAAADEGIGAAPDSIGIMRCARPTRKAGAP